MRSHNFSKNETRIEKTLKFQNPRRIMREWNWNTLGNDLKIQLELFFLVGKVVKNIGSNTNYSNPNAEHSDVRSELLESSSLIRLTHKHPWEHFWFRIVRCKTKGGSEWPKVDDKTLDSDLGFFDFLWRGFKPLKPNPTNPYTFFGIVFSCNVFYIWITKLPNHIITPTKM